MNIWKKCNKNENIHVSVLTTCIINNCSLRPDTSMLGNLKWFCNAMKKKKRIFYLLPNFLWGFLALVQEPIFTLFKGDFITLLFLVTCFKRQFNHTMFYLDIFAFFFWNFCALFPICIGYLAFIFIHCFTLLLVFFFANLNETVCYNKSSQNKNYILHPYIRYGMFSLVLSGSSCYKQCQSQDLHISHSFDILSPF